MMRSWESWVTYLGVAALVAALGWSYHYSAHLPEEIIDDAPIVMEQEIGRDIRLVEESGTHTGQELLSIGRMTARRRSTSPFAGFADVLIDDMRLVVTNLSAVQAGAPSRHSGKAYAGAREALDALHLKEDTLNFRRSLPKVTSYVIQRFNVRTRDAAGQVLPWLTAGVATIEMNRVGRIEAWLYDCVEVQNGQSNRYEKAELDLTRGLRVIPVERRRPRPIPRRRNKPSES